MSNDVECELEGGYQISTARERLDIDAIHDYLVTAYWCVDIPREVVERSIANSICFGVYAGADQIGFARVITDKATFAYIGDVYVLEAHRGRGLAKSLVRLILEHPELRGVRRFQLVTLDAQQLYAPFGFTNSPHPERHMEIRHQGLYRPS